MNSLGFFRSPHVRPNKVVRRSIVRQDVAAKRRVGVDKRSKGDWPMTTTTSTLQQTPSAGVKFFGGVVAGLSAAMITSSLLYLLWFIPLGRPGSHIPSVDE